MAKVDPRYFMEVWEKISSSVNVKGRFAGHFFGERDSWAQDEMQTHFTSGALKQLFENFNIEYFIEAEDDEPAADGEQKHWHIFHVVAQKFDCQ